MRTWTTQEHATRRTAHFDKLEKRIGESLGPWLRRKYETERLGYRAIGTLLGCPGSSGRSVPRLLRFFNIGIRRGGDAVATQWERAPGRREAQAARMSRVGKATGQRFLQQPHGGHEDAPAEIIAQRWLRDLGVAFIAQFTFERTMKGGSGPRTGHLDLWFPELRAGLEIFGSRTSLISFSARHARLKQLRMRVYYLPRRIFLDGKRTAFEQFVAALKRASLNPSAPPSPELMRWRHPNDMASG